MDRRTFAFASVAASSVMAFGRDEEASKTKSTASFEEFRFGEAVEFELKSSPAKWQGGDVHLICLNRFTFSFDSKIGQLTAGAKGSLLTFDNVDYTISVTVFAADGAMLGSSTAVCAVPRVWRGVYLQQPVDLTLDFGISNKFEHATKFMACISDRTVLNPDQWQDG